MISVVSVVKRSPFCSELMDVHPPKSGRPARQDYEYERNGVENLFMVFEPLRGKRFVFVEDRRRKIERAHVMKKVADELYPDAKKILVVLDNLNTHTPASFYEAFDPQEARRLVERFEFHYTPKHGSWLNMAEIGYCIVPSGNSWEETRFSLKLSKWEQSFT
jgi:hypothetical protein